MTELTTTLVQEIEKTGEVERIMGFQDGRRYQRIIEEMKSVESIGSGNRIYVEGAINEFDKEIEKMGEIYDSNLIQEYKIERIKLIKQLKN
jgi:hypothetical protein